MRILHGDICEASCDAVVNASNGIGFMGGKAGIRKRQPGVAESIHYLTGGQVERVAKKICKKHSFFGYAPGNVFVTPAFDLKCKYIIHAVTMRYPGTYSSIKTVQALLPGILEQARELGLKSVAIPLLGTGTGHVNQNKILKLYENFFEGVDDVQVDVYIYRK
ncbi:MAG: macro domain-containing protein [Bacteroidaceae bacterium]|nr:macro domain-containing protein [Bacteroidaceae bacterium]